MVLLNGRYFITLVGVKIGFWIEGECQSYDNIL